MELASPTPRRRPSCHLKPKAGTSKLASTHSTPTAATQSGLEHVGNHTAATRNTVQKRPQPATSGSDYLAHRAAQTSRRCANERRQHHVAMGAQIWPRRRQGGAFTSGEDHGGALNARVQNTHARNCANTLTQRSKARPAHGLGMTAHDPPLPCPRRPHTARRRQLARRPERSDGDRDATGATRRTGHAGLTLRLLEVTLNAPKTKRKKTPVPGKKGSAAGLDGAGSNHGA